MALLLLSLFLPAAPLAAEVYIFLDDPEVVTRFQRGSTGSGAKRSPEATRGPSPVDDERTARPRHAPGL